MEYLIAKIKKKVPPQKNWKEKSTQVLKGKKKILLTCNDGYIKVTYSNLDRSLPQGTGNKITNFYCSC